MALYALQSLWIAFSFRYPMLYDEGYHFNLIKLYSHSLSPILSKQPTSLDMYGDMVHHGSTLFHYLMSFPYRLVVHIVGSMTWQVVFLRVIDIILFGLGLLIFAKLFKEVSIKQKFINVATFLFIMLPIVPFVAATINYDNMLFPLTASFLLWGIKILKSEAPNWKLYLEYLLIGTAALFSKTGVRSYICRGLHIYPGAAMA